MVVKPRTLQPTTERRFDERERAGSSIATASASAHAAQFRAPGPWRAVSDPPTWGCAPQEASLSMVLKGSPARSSRKACGASAFQCGAINRHGAWGWHAPCGVLPQPKALHKKVTPGEGCAPCDTWWRPSGQYHGQRCNWCSCVGGTGNSCCAAHECACTGIQPEQRHIRNRD
jgi:hypothetical protein